MLSMLIFAAAGAAQPANRVPQTDIPAAASPICHDRGVETIDRREGGQGGAQRLNQLPNADEYLAVIRMDEKGCRKPVIVNYDIGSAPKKQH